jgi:hypothetical protein
MGSAEEMTLDRSLRRSHNLSNFPYFHSMENFQLKNDPLFFRERLQGLTDFLGKLFAV